MEVEKGKFLEWCKRHGFETVNQKAINAALREGGHAEKMAVFTVNFSNGKYEYPKWYMRLDEIVSGYDASSEERNEGVIEENIMKESILGKVGFEEVGWEKMLPGRVMTLKECVLGEIDFEEKQMDEVLPPEDFKAEDDHINKLKGKNYKFGE